MLREHLTAVGQVKGYMDRLTYIGHATTLIRLEGTSVLTDPMLRPGLGPLRRQGPPPPPALPKLAGRHPHLAPAPGPPGHPIAAAQSPQRRRSLSRAALRGWWRGRVPTRSWSSGGGETVSVGEVDVTAVPAEHGGRRGRWGKEIEPLGYVIRNETRSVYFAGDTDLFDEMSEVGPVDVALLPVWGWGPSVGEGHLDPETRGSSPDDDSAASWPSRSTGGPFIPPASSGGGPRRWRSRRTSSHGLPGELAPGVEVRVLQPGSETSLEV